MRPSTNPAFVEHLLRDKSNRKNQRDDQDDLPAPPAPHQPVCRPTRKRSLWSCLFGDPHERLDDYHDFEQHKIDRASGTTLFKIDADTRIEEAKIISRARIENTRHQVTLQLARQKNKNTGQTLIDEYQDQQNLLDQIEELPMPEEIKHRAARQVGRIYHKNSSST